MNFFNPYRPIKNDSLAPTILLIIYGLPLGESQGKFSGKQKFFEIPAPVQKYPDATHSFNKNTKRFQNCQVYFMRLKFIKY